MKKLVLIGISAIAILSGMSGCISVEKEHNTTTPQVRTTTTTETHEIRAY